MIDSLTAAKIAEKNDCYCGIFYTNVKLYPFYADIYVGVVFPFMGSLLLDRYHFILDDFEGNANINVAIKSSSTLSKKRATLGYLTSSSDELDF